MATRRNSPTPRLPAGRTRSIPLRLILLLALQVPLLGACLPPQASFSLGLGTSHIHGFIITAPEQTLPGGPLVVAYAYHHQFVTRADGTALLVPTGRVVKPGPQGDFVIDVPADVVRMEILFIAPGYLTDLFRFQRQLGVGDIEYRAALQAMPDWRSHYYTYLSPRLEELILDQRYRLAPAEQQLLGQWLRMQDARLAPKAGASAGSS